MDLPVQMVRLAVRSARAGTFRPCFSCSHALTPERHPAGFVIRRRRQDGFIRAVNLEVSDDRRGTNRRNQTYPAHKGHTPVEHSAYLDLRARYDMPADEARLKAVTEPRAGDWLNASPLKAIGLRLSDEALRVAVGYRLGCIICQPHICISGTTVDARRLHGLSSLRADQDTTRFKHNDIIWRAIMTSQIQAIKEQIDISLSDGKRTDGATIIPYKREKPLAWRVIVPNTYAACPIG